MQEAPEGRRKKGVGHHWKGYLRLNGTRETRGLEWMAKVSIDSFALRAHFTVNGVAPFLR